MDPATGTIIATAANTVNGIAGLIGQRKRERRNFNYTTRLMDIQFKNQQKLNKQGQELQLDTWEKTNYPYQIKMLKAAGMNPSLLYGKGGQGGVTGSQGGGSASLGAAPNIQQMPNLMDISNSMRLGAELNLMKAQKDKTDAERKEIEARTPTYGVLIDKSYAEIQAIIAQTGNLEAQKALTEANTEWQKIQNEFANRTFEDNVKSVVYNNVKLINEIVEGDARAKVAKETTDTTIAQIQANAVKQTLEIALLKENIAKTKVEAQEIISKTNLIDTERFQSWQKLDQREREIEIKKYEAEIAWEWKEFGTGALAQTALLTGSIGNLFKGVSSIIPAGIGGKPVAGFGKR